MSIPGVVIVAAAGAFAPSGRQLSGPVDSVDKFAKLIVWAAGKGYLNPGARPDADGAAPARIWVVGEDACRVIADESEDGSDDFTPEKLGRSLAVLVGRGWAIRGEPDGRFTLARDEAGRHIEVEVFAEPQPWLAVSTNPAGGDTQVLAQRLTQWVATMHRLPEASPRASAAAVGDEIMTTRSLRPAKRAVVVTEPGPLPAGVEVDVRIQPSWTASREAVEEDLDRAEALIWLEQERAELASAGMIILGTGQPRTLSGAAAAEAAAGSKRPFALWHATLPAGNDLTVPEGLPLPHPRMRDTETVQAWITTEDVDGLCQAVRDGGAGMQVAQLRIDAAIVWPQQGRLLETWANRFRDACDACTDDPTMQEIFEAAAVDYIAGLADPDSPGWHFHPAWLAAIAAHIRYRWRRAAMRISREDRLWPIHATGTAMIYAAPLDEKTKAAVELADTHKTTQGRLVARRQVEISNDTFLAVAVAENPQQVAAALTAALDITREEDPDPQTGQQAPCDDAQEPDPAVTAQDPPAPPTTDTPEPPDDDAADAQESSAPTAKAAARPRKKRGAKSSGGVPAAVLDTDGLWFPDGSCIAISGPLPHAGEIAELAYAHGIGYRLSESFVEWPQIWITEDACIAYGIDVDEIGRRDRGKALRLMTAELEIATAAIADGWKLGVDSRGGRAGRSAGYDEDDDDDVDDLDEDDVDDAHGLATWTTVRRDGDERLPVLIALIPGMDPSVKEMPIFGGDPSPAAVARRLQLLADALRFPWKFSGQTTGINIMKQARPARSWTPREWIDVVMAPSTTPRPPAMTHVTAAFDWCRPPGTDELNLRYVHAYDRGGSWAAALAGLELPIGEAVHHPEGIAFKPNICGYWLIEIPDPANWNYPHILNPKMARFTAPKWVCTPTLERAAELGYEPEIIEAWTWPQHGRVLNGWYERFRDAATILDTDDPDAQAARDQAKVVRTRSFGTLLSRSFEGRTCYSPERYLFAVAKANANIIYRITQIGETTGVWPLAVHADTILYASNDPDPLTAWPGDAKNFGWGFGQYKPEGSALLADHLPYLEADGHRSRSYTGKDELVRYEEWKLRLPELRSQTEVCGGP